MLKKFTTKPKFVNIKNSNVIIFKVLFFWDYVLNNKTKDSLLERLLFTTNSKYKTNREFGIKIDTLSIIKCKARISYFANKTCLTCTLIVPRENLLENYSLDDCLEFFYDTIFNVNAFNGEFSEEAFNREKDYIREMVKYEASNIYDIMYEAKVDAINSIEKTYLTRKEVLKNLDNISPKDLYDYYEKNVKNNTYITYISGNLEGKDRIYSLYNKYFKQKNKKIEIDIRYYDVIKIGTYEKKLINVDYKQTVLNLIYQFKNLQEDEMILLETLYYFVNSRENDLIHNALRRVHGLVYENDIYVNTRGFIEIIAYLDKNSIEKAKEIINGVFNDIKVEENFNKYKNKLLKALKYDIYFKRDKVLWMADNKFNKDIGDDYNIEQKYKLIKDVNYEKMKKFLESATLVREIVITGDKNV